MTMFIPRIDQWAFGSPNHLFMANPAAGTASLKLFRPVAFINDNDGRTWQQNTGMNNTLHMISIHFTLVTSATAISRYVHLEKQDESSSAVICKFGFFQTQSASMTYSYSFMYGIAFQQSVAFPAPTGQIVNCPMPLLTLNKYEKLVLIGDNIQAADQFSNIAIAFNWVKDNQ